jgi:type IV secretion system protein VirB9
MMRGHILSAVLVALSATAVFAERIPSPSTLDHRVRSARFVDGQVYTVRVSLTRATTLEFEGGETVVSIVAGDTDSFQFEGVPGGQVVAIKPTARGAVTNVSIYTTERSYYFRLVEGNAPFYVVRFKYPEKKVTSRSVRQKQASGRYGANEKTQITPVAVTDDGTFTYFRFAKDGPVPAIFQVSSGQERATNSVRIKNGMMRVSGTSRQWALRLGEVEVCIVELGDGGG